MLTNQHMDTVMERLAQAMRDLPDPSVTLVGKKFKDPFLVLISCLLSLRTRDTVTLPVSEKLFEQVNTPDGFLKLSAEQIEKLIYPVCFYRNKAKAILSICRDLNGRFGGKVPGTLEELLTLKGVGRKTANLVITEGFTQPAMCVDTHVHRISNRLGYIETAAPLDTEMALRKKLPAKYWGNYNALLVTWGQNICKPISPLCSQCPVNTICERRGVTKSR